MERRRKTDQPPQAASPQDAERYRRAWSSYVVRRNVVVALFVSFVFLGFVIGKLKLGEPADFAILLVWSEFTWLVVGGSRNGSVRGAGRYWVTGFGRSAASVAI